MNEKEIRKLRKKFIGIAMLSFVLVAVFVGALINVMNYYVTQKDINWSLEQIASGRENFKDQNDPAGRLPEAPSFAEVFSPSYHRNAFYIFEFDENGEEILFHASHEDAYSIETIKETAAAIIEQGAKQGKSGMYYYQSNKGDDNKTTLVLLDCSATIFSRMRLLYSSLIVGCVAVLISFVLVIVFSKKMIQPEIEMSKRQTQFLTNVSHELKTPLAVIRSNAEMEEISRGESEWTQSTVRQVDRMTALIKNLVMITKQREQESDREIQAIDISAAISQTVNEFAGLAEKEGIVFEKKIHDGVTLLAEESKIRQLAMILLDNAVKYCDKNGRISVSLEPVQRTKRGVCFTVSNSYANGSQEDCSKFFDRFYREDKAHNIDMGGFGIGLSIAESICEQYKGTIRSQWYSGMISFICELY